MQKHTKRQVKDNLKKGAFISDVCHRCLCVISDQTEMAKEKEYLRHDAKVFGVAVFIFECWNFVWVSISGLVVRKRIL